MKELDVNKLDKYEITERMQELKEFFEDPETHFYDMSDETYQEIVNPQKDAEGYIPIYYLSDGAKAWLRMYEHIKMRTEAQKKGIKLRQPRPLQKRR